MIYRTSHEPFLSHEGRKEIARVMTANFLRLESVETFLCGTIL